MALDLRVFSLSVILLLVSCNSFNKPIFENREIILEKEVDTKENILNKEQDSIKGLKHKKIESGSISTIFLNGSDLWIGKLGGALVRHNLYTGVSKKFLDDNYSIKDFSIKKIIDTPDYILALQSDRIVKINKSNSELSIEILPSSISRASDIVKYKNSYYISTFGYGILEYNLKTSMFRNFITDIKFISSLELENDNLLIGSMNNGLYSYELKKRKYNSRRNIPNPIFNKNITKLMLKDGVLWLGTAKNGLIKWDKESNKIDRIYPKEGVSFIYSNSDINVVSFIGHGIYIESQNGYSLESIKTSLVTNNITSVVYFNNKLITGNIRKGIIEQELKSLNDQKVHN